MLAPWRNRTRQQAVIRRSLPDLAPGTPVVIVVIGKSRKCNILLIAVIAVIAVIVLIVELVEMV